MITYIGSIGLCGNFQKEYGLWAWLFRAHKEDIKPHWYARHAIAAHNVDNYTLVIKLVKLALLHLECAQPILYSVLATSYNELRNYEQADRYFQEYFSLVTEKDVDHHNWLYYARACYFLEKYKNASHYMGLYLAHTTPEMVHANDYASAAVYAFRSNNHGRAQEFWEKYFSFDMCNEGTINLALAGLFYGVVGNHTRSTELLESHFKMTPREEWNYHYALRLGNCYNIIMPVSGIALFFWIITSTEAV